MPFLFMYIDSVLGLFLEIIICVMCILSIGILIIRCLSSLHALHRTWLTEVVLFTLVVEDVTVVVVVLGGDE